jgi:hypothetical protein
MSGEWILPILDFIGVAGSCLWVRGDDAATVTVPASEPKRLVRVPTAEV